MNHPTSPSVPSLVETARLFLRLGTTAFGGPAAHIAAMEDEVVRRRRWLTREQFLDYLGATNLIPGPNSTELAIHIGMARHGWAGLLVAGGCFILPVLAHGRSDLTTATFVGYLVGGATGAAVATVGIFLPAFVFVALSGPLVPALRRSRVAGAVLDGVNVASLAMMAAVTLQLGSATLRAPLPAALASLSLVLLTRYSINPTWLVAAGATAGWIFERSL